VDGPYYEESLGYSEVGGDDRHLTLYHSADWIRAMCEAPGSPFVLSTRAEHEARLKEAETLKEELEVYKNRVAYLENAYDRVLQPPPIDVEALANALVVPLGNTFARKAGRKPREDAA
jgi:hypothetical protein